MPNGRSRSRRDASLVQRQAMACEVDQQLFDSEGRVRVGEMIGSTMRQGGSEFGYLRRRA
jgi:hypothetical protein